MGRKGYVAWKDGGRDEINIHSPQWDVPFLSKIYYGLSTKDS